MRQKRRLLDQKLQSAQRIAITSHRGLDYDALTSSLAIHSYLKKRFPSKEVQIYHEDPPTSEWAWLEGKTKINFSANIAQQLNQADLVVFLDSQALHRVTQFPEQVQLSNFQSIRIDHHPSEGDNFNLDICDTSAGATAQLLAEVLFSQNAYLTPRIAKLLLVGILGDTGGLRYLNPTTSKLLNTVKRLIDVGNLSLESLWQRMDQLNQATFKLITMLMENATSVKIGGKPGLTYSFLPRAVLDNYTTNDINHAYHHFLHLFARNLKDYPWGFTVAPGDRKRLKISFRSSPGAPQVDKLAKKYNGGGHPAAAGAKWDLSQNQALDSFELCQDILHTIQKTALPLLPKT